MGKVMEAVMNRFKPRMTLEAYKEKMRAVGFNDEGVLIPDSIPLAPPIGYREQESMVEIVRRMVRDEALQRELDEKGVETFEEADDFEIGDEPSDPSSPWENDFDPPIKEVVAEGNKEIARKRAAKRAEKPAEGDKAAREGE